MNLKNDSPNTNQNKILLEKLDGRDLYYQGYYYQGYQKMPFELFPFRKKLMGYDAYRALILEYILSLFFANMNRTKYRIFVNCDVKIDSKNHITHDIAIFDTKKLNSDRVHHPYINVPSVLALEIDIKVDLSSAVDRDYVKLKTQKVLNFGAERVIWVFTHTKQVMVADADKAWSVYNWNQKLEIWPRIRCHIPGYLDKVLKKEDFSI